MSNTNAAASARTEFAAALNQICSERGIEPEVVLDTIKAAILAAFRKDSPELFVDQEEGSEEKYAVTIDPVTGSAQIKEIETDKDVTPPGFGRIAAQTAKQVILQRVREAEKDAIIGEYEERVGTLVSGMVLRFDGKNVIIDIGRGQGVMPPEEQISGEFYKMNQRIAVFISDIRDTMRGKTIIVSRATPELVKELFAREVPEVASGAVEIKAVAREAGHRTKIAVASTQDGVDPVGSCVGQKGVRVQEVISELNNEKIDIIQFSDNLSNFITAALAPAENLNIDINEDKKSAVVTVPDDQLSLAIGKGGQNVRLAAKLTGYKIDIKGQSGEAVASGSEDDKFEIDTLELSSRVKNVLVKAEITTLDGLRTALEDKIEGVGPKAIEEIKAALDKVAAPKPEETKAEAPEAEDKDQSASEAAPTESTETPAVDAEITSTSEETSEEISTPKTSNKPKAEAAKPTTVDQE